MADDYSANDERELALARRQLVRRPLSSLQQQLLVRALEQEHEGRGCSVFLEPHEVAAAVGLEARAPRLIRTYRPPAKLSYSARPRYAPGSRRSYNLTVVGRAIALEIPKGLRPIAAPPLPGLTECRRLALELALDVLRERPSQYLVNRARGVVERVRGDAQPDEEVDHAS